MHDAYANSAHFFRISRCMLNYFIVLCRGVVVKNRRTEGVKKEQKKEEARSSEGYKSILCSIVKLGLVFVCLYRCLEWKNQVSMSR